MYPFPDSIGKDRLLAPKVGIVVPFSTLLPKLEKYSIVTLLLCRYLLMYSV